MQRLAAHVLGELAMIELPAPEAAVVGGVRWGRYDVPLTPAFWAAQAAMFEVGPRGFRLGENLAEETIACLLGGHGDPAEVGHAAFVRVRDAVRDRGNVRLSLEEAEKLLTEPLDVNGRWRRYRFARQRARYLAAALEGVQRLDEDALDDLVLRDALCALPGIGPKTASWVLRNRRGSDRVAILDVHVVRACELMGLFPANSNPARSYAELETRFLNFCVGVKVRASVLDAVIWEVMRGLSRNLYAMIVDRHLESQVQSRRAWGGRDKCQAPVETEAILAAAAVETPASTSVDVPGAVLSIAQTLPLSRA